MRYAPTRFPGSIARSRAIGDFVLTETRYASGEVLRTHAHEYACLVIVLDGTFDERYAAKSRTVDSGTVIMRPEGELHSDSFGNRGGRCLNVEMDPQWLSRVREAAAAVDRSASYTSGAFAIYGRRLHAELVSADELSPLMIESLVLGLFDEGHGHDQRRTRSAPQWLLRAKALIDDDATVRLTLSDLAAEAGVHPVHLATTFHRCFGSTVARYVRHVRIEAACRHLIGSDASLADVAAAAGFSDQSHFGRRFKEAIGMTPSEYRARSGRVG